MSPKLPFPYGAWPSTVGVLYQVKVDGLAALSSASRTKYRFFHDLTSPPSFNMYPTFIGGNFVAEDFGLVGDRMAADLDDDDDDDDDAEGEVVSLLLAAEPLKND